jgi:phospholipid/cholesterol/gamma-HCH transport system permease protein
MNSPAQSPASYSLLLEEAEIGLLKIDLSGSIALNTIKDLMADVEGFLNKPGLREIVLDLADVHFLDSTGALALITLRDKAAEKSVTLSLTRMSVQAERIMHMVREHDLAGEPEPKQDESPGLLEQIGIVSIRAFDHAILLLLFIGDVAFASLGALVQPRSIRWDAVLWYMKKAGLDGLPIVGLISLLLGLIMAFMASLQLRLFGANLYVASLVAIALVRELGPIMTAIIFAGRSGSAFSAEIGTMMINDEVDALTTMGFDPVKFLVLPKIISSVVVVPILTCYAVFLGILGGLLVGLGMDLTLHSYTQQTLQSIQIFDIVTSLIKCVCFAVLIASISCHRGFQARGGAEAVGSVTTSAVVSSIFLIIITDSAFAIILYYIR